MSTVSRNPHVAAHELREGAEAIAQLTLMPSPSMPPFTGADPSAALALAA